MRPRRCDACGHEHPSDSALRLSAEVERWSSLRTVRGRVDLCPKCTALARPIPVAPRTLPGVR